MVRIGARMYSKSKIESSSFVVIIVFELFLPRIIVSMVSKYHVHLHILPEGTMGYCGDDGPFTWANGLIRKAPRSANEHLSGYITIREWDGLNGTVHHVRRYLQSRVIQHRKVSVNDPKTTKALGN